MDTNNTSWSFNSFGTAGTRPPFSYRDATLARPPVVAHNANELSERICDCTKDIVRIDLFGPHQKGVWRILPISRNEIASASYDHITRIFNTDEDSHEASPKALKFHTREVLSLVLQDENTLITGSSDGTMSFWKIDTAENIGSISESKKNTTGFYSMALLDNHRIATGACQRPQKLKRDQIWNHNIKIWDLAKKTTIGHLKGHTGGISALVNAGERLVSSSADKTIRIWDANESKCLGIIQAHSDYIYSVASLSNNHVVSGSRDRTVKIWDLETGKQIGALTSEGSSIAHDSTVYDVASFQEHLILTGSRDGFVKVWDQRTSNSIVTLDAEDGFVYSVAGLPNGKIAAGTDRKNPTTSKNPGGSVAVWEFQQ